MRGVVLHELHRFLRDEVRGVALVAARGVVAVPVEPAVAEVGEVVDRAVVVAVLVVESAAGRQIFPFKVAQVPLATDRRLVARLTQGLRQHPFLEGQSVLGPGSYNTHLKAVAHRVAPRHKRRSRRRAKGGGMELRVAQSIRRDAVHGRRWNNTAEGTSYAVALIVGHYEEHVGCSRGRHHAGRPVRLRFGSPFFDNPLKFLRWRGQLATFNRNRRARRTGCTGSLLRPCRSRTDSQNAC